LRLLLLGDLEITSSVVLTSLGEVRSVAPPRGANLALEDFGSKVIVTSLLARCGAVFSAFVAKVASTGEYFSSNLEAENFTSTFRYWHCVSYAISNFACESEVDARGHCSQIR